MGQATVTAGTLNVTVLRFAPVRCIKRNRVPSIKGGILACSCALRAPGVDDGHQREHARHFDQRAHHGGQCRAEVQAIARMELQDV